MTNAYRIGGMTTDTLTGRVVKIAALGAAVLAGAGQCFKIAGADYQVTAGKTFYPTGIILASGLNVYVYLLYADNAALTTNPVSMGFTTVIVALPAMIIPCAGVAAVPGGKYVGVWNPGGASTATYGIIILGYEE